MLFIVERFKFIYLWVVLLIWKERKLLFVITFNFFFKLLKFVCLCMRLKYYLDFNVGTFIFFNALLYYNLIYIRYFFQYIIIGLSVYFYIAIYFN